MRPFSRVDVADDETSAPTTACTDKGANMARLSGNDSKSNRNHPAFSPQLQGLLFWVVVRSMWLQPCLKQIRWFYAATQRYYEQSGMFQWLKIVKFTTPYGSDVWKNGISVRYCNIGIFESNANQQATSDTPSLMPHAYKFNVHFSTSYQIDIRNVFSISVHENKIPNRPKTVEYCIKNALSIAAMLSQTRTLCPKNRFNWIKITGWSI